MVMVVVVIVMMMVMMMMVMMMMVMVVMVVVVMVVRELHRRREDAARVCLGVVAWEIASGIGSSSSAYDCAGANGVGPASALVGPAPFASASAEAAPTSPMIVLSNGRSRSVA